jgi:outer membrane protein
MPVISRKLISILTAALMPLAHADINLDALQLIVNNQEISPIPQGWTMGAVAYAGSSPYQAASHSVMAIPGAIYIGKQTMYLGDRLLHTFYENKDFNIYGVGRFRGGNLNPEDHAEWAGLKQRKWELDAGIGTHIYTPVGLITARVSSDISGRSKGQDALLWFDAPIVREKWAVMPGMGMIWRSKNLANYYYGGVSSEEATAVRPAYDVGSTLSLSASLVMTYRFSRHWLGGIVLAAERYPNAIKNSPLINKKGEYDLLMGVGYVW